MQAPVSGTICRGPEHCRDNDYRKYRVPPRARCCARWTALKARPAAPSYCRPAQPRSEEHTSELQSLMRISYAVFCLKKKSTYFSAFPSFPHSSPPSCTTRARDTDDSTCLLITYLSFVT